MRCQSSSEPAAGAAVEAAGPAWACGSASGLQAGWAATSAAKETRRIICNRTGFLFMACAGPLRLARMLRLPPRRVNKTRWGQTLILIISPDLRHIFDF